MMRSMYSGVSGLRNHQTRMDVVGNNIANVNTTGYKKSRVVFKDAFYQASRGASRPNAERGGTNPMAVGLGMTLASIDQIHTPAPTTTTNKTTDMAIDGNGYFALNLGDNRYYTRAGAFDFDTDGKLVSTANGYQVQGWLTNRVLNAATGDWAIDTTPDPSNISLSDYKSILARATQAMNFAGNLDSGTTIPGAAAVGDVQGLTVAPATNWPTDAQTVPSTKVVYDSLGNPVTLNFRFFKTAVTAAPLPSTSTWACDISIDPLFQNGAGYVPANSADVDASAAAAAGTITNDNIVRVHNITFDDTGVIPTASNAGFTLNYARADVGAEPLAINVDFKELTQYNNKSSARVEKQDGYKAGDLTSYTIGTDGTITGIYSNDVTRSLARVALFTFENPAGLKQNGSNLFTVSSNSGDPVQGAPGEGGKGAIIPGSLEMSNVDLSEEFTDMIVTQRGFQANSRIITTSDEMLQELVNLKR